MTFKELYNIAPDQLKLIIDRTRKAEQSLYWHPEGNTYIHIELVTNRLENYNDINLTLAGLFHDLGKVDTTAWDVVKSSWVAHNHEDYSAKYVDMFADWIISLGGDVEIIKEIVLNHMRIKFIDEMKYSKKVTLVSHKHFELIRKFQTADYGGFGDTCKEPIDVKFIQDRIKKMKKNFIQRFFDTFYIRGSFFVKTNKFYILKTKKSFVVEVQKGIRDSKRVQIKF